MVCIAGAINMIEFAPRSVDIMTYQEAVLYCLFLEYGGHKDWQLPTLEDFDGVIDPDILWGNTAIPFLFWIRDDTFGTYAYTRPVRYYD
jgi:hypothetical protein